MTAALIPNQAFSPEQLQRRRLTLGASEIPCVAGLNPYKSALALWAEKRGMVKSFEGNEFTHWGNILEPVILGEYARVMQVEITKPETIISSTEPWRSCSPDSLVVGGDRGVEAKCRGEYLASEWGEPGTDEVPHDVAIQCHWSMDILQIPRWDVVTLIGGNKFRIYHLVYSEEIAASLRSIGREFWNYVESGTEPPIDGSAATTAFLKSRFPSQRGEMLRSATTQEDAWLADLRDVREELKHLETRETELKNSLMQAIGEDPGIVGLNGKATWKAPSGSIVSWKSVAEEVNAPASVIAKHSKPQSRRFLPTFPK